MQWGEQSHIPCQCALCMRIVTRCRTQKGNNLCQCQIMPEHCVLNKCSDMARHWRSGMHDAGLSGEYWQYRLCLCTWCHTVLQIDSDNFESREVRTD